MMVLGKNCFIFDTVHGRTCDVEPFDRSLGVAKSIPVVDAALAYDCPITHESYLLIIRNALYVETMEVNLLSPLIMREAGLLVNDTPKIHVDDPNEHHHAIVFPDDDLSIPLRLNGTFSYFHSRIPTFDEVKFKDPIFLTPDSDNWDPYAEHFASNEESMVDWEGNMAPKRHRKEHVLDLNVSVDESTYDSAVEAATISSFNAMSLNDCHDDDITGLAAAMSVRAEQSKFAIGIGSTSADQDVYSDLFEPIYADVSDFKAEIDSAQAARPKTVSPEFLSKIWNIKPDLAKKTLAQTTQLCRKGADNDLSRQYSTNDRMLRYKRIDSQFFTDTFFVTAKGKSTRGNTCAQLFVSDKGYVAIYPMSSKGDYKDALHKFCKDVGVPTTLLVDPSGEQTSKKARKFCNQVGTTLKVLEESTQWANRAELYVGLLKSSISKDLSRTNSPMKLWDYCAERRQRIHNVIPRDLFQLNGNNPITATFGTQADISNICIFGWYDWCYFREESHVQFPFQKRNLGRVLGPLQNEGNEMTQAVLTITGKVVPRRTCAPLTISEINSPSEKDKRNKFDNAILKLFGDSMTVPDIKPKPIDTDIFDLLDDDVEEPIQSLEEDPIDADGTTAFEKPVTDALIHAELVLPHGEKMSNAKVKGRAKDTNGDEVGTFDPNPLLNSVLYDVEFSDGDIRQYSANIIAENMYSQVDEEGYSKTLFDSIVDYRSDGKAVTKDKMFVYTKSGQKRHRKNTEGWKLLVRFKDESEQWVPLKVMKETNPVDVAVFAKAEGIDDEPAFAWWVPYTLRTRDRIISAVNSRVKKVTMKYGHEVPRNLDDCRRIDAANGDSRWAKAIDKEMPNVKVAFEILEKDQPIPIG